MYNNELYHYGVLGMKWGVRRYRNKDGSLTDAGRKRYYNDDGSLTPVGQKRVYKTVKYYDRKGKKNWKMRSGQAVGEDEMITKAAKEVVKTGQKDNKYIDKVSIAESKLREAYENESDRLYRKEEQTGKTYSDIDHKKIYDTAWKNVNKTRVRKEYDSAVEEQRKAYKEYQSTVRKKAEECLGKYGDRKLRTLTNGQIHTATDALAGQIDWGIGVGRVKDLD